MDVDEIKGALARALPMRPPRWPPPPEDSDALPPGPAEKIMALEDYLMESAYVAAELEEALFWLDATIVSLREKVENLTGYEVALPKKAQDRITGADIMRAKRTVDQPTFEAGAEAKQLRASIIRQIDRLRFEEQWIVSRAYSLISGS